MGNWTNYCFRPRPPKIWEDLAAFRKYHIRDWFDKQNKNNPDGWASLKLQGNDIREALTHIEAFSFWKGLIFLNYFTKNHAFLTLPVSKFSLMLWKISKPTPKQPQPHKISLQSYNFPVSLFLLSCYVEGSVVTGLLILAIFYVFPCITPVSS